MSELMHKSGCPANGGYGHGPEPCICGAAMSEPLDLEPIQAELISQKFIWGGWAPVIQSLIEEVKQQRAEVARLRALQPSRAETPNATTVQDSGRPLNVAHQPMNFPRWKCRECGCLWRDNLDGSVSLFDAKQKSCQHCEMLPIAESCVIEWFKSHAEPQALYNLLSQAKDALAAVIADAESEPADSHSPTIAVEAVQRLVTHWRCDSTDPFRSAGGRETSARHAEELAALLPAGSPDDLSVGIAAVNAINAMSNEEIVALTADLEAGSPASPADPKGDR